jgi:hypothetical protein
VPFRDVQEAASHAGPRTTMRYDRARVSLDRHATYIVSTYIAGAGPLTWHSGRQPDAAGAQSHKPASTPTADSERCVDHPGLVMDC